MVDLMKDGDIKSRYRASYSDWIRSLTKFWFVLVFKRIKAPILDGIVATMFLVMSVAIILTSPVSIPVIAVTVRLLVRHRLRSYYGKSKLLYDKERF